MSPGSEDREAWGSIPPANSGPWLIGRREQRGNWHGDALNQEQAGEVSSGVAGPRGLRKAGNEDARTLPVTCHCVTVSQAPRQVPGPGAPTITTE